MIVKGNTLLDKVKSGVNIKFGMNPYIWLFWCLLHPWWFALMKHCVNKNGNRRVKFSFGEE